MFNGLRGHSEDTSLGGGSSGGSSGGGCFLSWPGGNRPHSCAARSGLCGCGGRRRRGRVGVLEGALHQLAQVGQHLGLLLLLRRKVDQRQRLLLLRCIDLWGIMDA